MECRRIFQIVIHQFFPDEDALFKGHLNKRISQKSNVKSRQLNFDFFLSSPFIYIFHIPWKEYSLIIINHLLNLLPKYINKPPELTNYLLPILCFLFSIQNKKQFFCSHYVKYVIHQRKQQIPIYILPNNFYLAVSGIQRKKNRK